MVPRAGNLAYYTSIMLNAFMPISYMPKIMLA